MSSEGSSRLRRVAGWVAVIALAFAAGWTSYAVLVDDGPNPPRCRDYSPPDRPPTVEPDVRCE